MDSECGWDTIGEDVQREILSSLICSKRIPMNQIELWNLYQLEKNWTILRLVCKRWRRTVDLLFKFEYHFALERATRRQRIQSAAFLVDHAGYPIEKIVEEFRNCMYIREWEMGEVLKNSAIVEEENRLAWFESQITYYRKLSKHDNKKFNKYLIVSILLGAVSSPFIIASCINLANDFKIVCQRPLQGALIAGIIVVVLANFLFFLFVFMERNSLKYKLLASIIPSSLIAWMGISIGLIPGASCERHPASVITLCVVAAIIAITSGIIIYRSKEEDPPVQTNSLNLRFPVTQTFQGNSAENLLYPIHS